MLIKVKGSLYAISIWAFYEVEKAYKISFEKWPLQKLGYFLCLLISQWPLTFSRSNFGNDQSFHSTQWRPQGILQKTFLILAIRP